MIEWIVSLVHKKPKVEYEENVEMKIKTLSILRVCVCIAILCVVKATLIDVPLIFTF